MKEYYSKIACDTPKLCRFSHGPMSMTLVSWQPEYDREGNVVNSGTDPNTTTQEIHCNHCGRSFTLKTQYNETHVIEHKQLLNEQSV